MDEPPQYFPQVGAYAHRRFPPLVGLIITVRRERARRPMYNAYRPSVDKGKVAGKIFSTIAQNSYDHYYNITYRITNIYNICRPTIHSAYTR